MILEFLERYWGDADFRISCYHSNTPDPGAQYQHWHRDANTHGIDRGGNVTMQNCPHFGIKIPLVDTTEENGSFEVVPGSQYLNEFPAEAGMSWDDVLNAEGRAVDAAFGQTRRLNLKKGSMWVQDPRALHRGTPNTSAAARPELVICCKIVMLSRFVALSVSLTPKVSLFQTPATSGRRRAGRWTSRRGSGRSCG